MNLGGTNGVRQMELGQMELGHTSDCDCDQESTSLHSGHDHKYTVTRSTSQRVLIPIVPVAHLFGHASGPSPSVVFVAYSIINPALQQS